MAVIGCVAVGAAGLGVLVWTAGGSAECDDVALAQAMTDAMSAAEGNGALEAQVSMPAECTDDDLVEAMPFVSREWHAMPGATIMREGEHPE